jgi:peptidoglycan/LPS O-acetylase OafA/YrhL
VVSEINRSPPGRPGPTPTKRRRAAIPVRFAPFDGLRAVAALLMFATHVNE